MWRVLLNNTFRRLVRVFSLCVDFIRHRSKQQLIFEAWIAPFQAGKIASRTICLQNHVQAVLIVEVGCCIYRVDTRVICRKCALVFCSPSRHCQFLFSPFTTLVFAIFINRCGVGAWPIRRVPEFVRECKSEQLPAA